MINLNTYNEHILDMILERASGNMVFQLFPRLKVLLQEIDHPISKKLLELSNDNDGVRKITYLDYELFTNKKDKEDVRFTFSQSDKVFTYFNNKKIDVSIMPDMLNKNVTDSYLSKKIPRVPGKIGKVIKSLFGDEFVPSGKPSEDIESFTNAIKSKLIINFDNFKIVEGDDIVKYYDGSMYVEYSAGSVLGGSCMKGSSCSEYIEFYNLNKASVKLVIMFGDDDDGKIAGRALLWTLSAIDGEPTDRLFMDRIYATNDIEIDMFKSFAKKNEWLHKYAQNMDIDEYIVDTKTGEKSHMELGIRDITDNGEYPYMDTMKIYDIDDGTLSNSTSFSYGTKYTLESTSGGYDDEEEDEREYIEYYDDYFEMDDLQWCALGDDYRTHDDAEYVDWEGEYATEDWLSEYATYSDREDKYIDIDDTVHLGYYDEWVSTGYASNNMVYSELTDDHFDEGDAYFSEHHKTWIHEDETIDVVIDYGTDDTDYRKRYDDTYFEYNYLDEDGDKEVAYYDNSLKDHFIKAVLRVDPREKDVPFVWDDDYNAEVNLVLFDKIDDKDKYFEWKGHYFVNKLKTNITGQMRIW